MQKNNGIHKTWSLLSCITHCNTGHVVSGDLYYTSIIWVMQMGEILVMQMGDLYYTCVIQVMHMGELYYTCVINKIDPTRNSFHIA